MKSTIKNVKITAINRMYHLIIMFLASMSTLTGYAQNPGDPIKYYSGNKWGDVFDATILEVKDSMVLVHINGASSLSDEWVGKSKIKLVSTGNFVPVLGETVTAFSKSDNAWYSASVKEIKNNQIFIHYKGYDSKYDEWVSLNEIQKYCPKLDYYNNHTDLVPDAFSMVDKSKFNGEKVIQVVILDNDWTYIKNGFGVITSRIIHGKGVCQDTKSGLYYEIDIEYSQQNTSSGGNGYAGTVFSRTDIAPGSNYFTESCLPK